MTTSSRTSAAKPKRAKKPAAPKARGVRSAAGVAKKRARKSATNVAISTELAPAVAIALLEKTEQAPGDPPPALDCLAAAATPSETKGKVRVELLFESGAVLPVEMSKAAGAALSKKLSEDVAKK